MFSVKYFFHISTNEFQLAGTGVTETFITLDSSGDSRHGAPSTSCIGNFTLLAAHRELSKHTLRYEFRRQIFNTHYRFYQVFLTKTTFVF